jgi:transcriptional regulator with XRE-family HTH domain
MPQDTPVNQLGTMLRDGRKRSGLSQRAAAQQTGVDFTYLSKIENGHITTGISEDLLRRLAALYDLDSDVLLVVAHKCPADLAALLASDLTAVQLLRAYARAGGPTPTQIEAATRRFLDECMQPGDESRAMRAALTAGWSTP